MYTNINMNLIIYTTKNSKINPTSYRVELIRGGGWSKEHKGAPSGFRV